MYIQSLKFGRPKHLYQEILSEERLIFKKTSNENSRNCMSVKNSKSLRTSQIVIYNQFSHSILYLYFDFMNLNFNNGNFAQLEAIPIHLIRSTKIIETNIIYINIQMKCTRLK